MAKARRSLRRGPAATSLFVVFVGCVAAQPVATVPAPAPVASSGAQVVVAAPPPGPSPQMAHVRVIHASPDPMAAAVAVYLDNAPTATIPNLTYRSAAGYTDIAAGEHTAGVRGPTVPASTPPVFSWRTPVLQPDHTYTIIAHGLAFEQPTVGFAPDEDDNTLPPAGQARVRFFHAIAGQGPVDLCIGNTPAFINVPYGTWGTPPGVSGHYLTAPSGAPVQLALHARSSSPCAGRLLGTVQAAPPDRSVISLVAVGREGHVSVARELLVCLDAPLPPGVPSTCTPMPLVR